MRTAIKTALLAGHVVRGLSWAVVMKLEGGRRLKTEAMTQWWNAGLLRVLKIDVRQSGTRAAESRLIIANHVSWLDISVFAASEQTRFISKAEVEHWPVAGWFAKAAGSFFIARGGGHTRRLNEQLAAFFRTRSGNVILFPEGTTTDGHQVLRFHSRLFAAAVETQTLIQPVAIRYAPAADGREIAPFIGDDDMLSHLLRVLAQPRMSAELIWCEPFSTAGLDRDAAAQKARAAICKALGLPSGQELDEAADFEEAPMRRAAFG